VEGAAAGLAALEPLSLVAVGLAAPSLVAAGLAVSLALVSALAAGASLAGDVDSLGVGVAASDAELPLLLSVI
jgi:hypothetical protein